MAIQANTTGTDQDDSTAGAQIRQYLTSQGKEYTPANVRAVLAMNARNPNQAGPDVVEGLRNYDPGVGQGGSAARKVGSGSRGAAVNPPPADLGGNPGGFETVDSGSGAPTTSAAPQSQLDLTNMILTGLGLGGAGAGGLYAYSKYAGRPTPTDLNGPAVRPIAQGQGDIIDYTHMPPEGQDLTTRPTPPPTEAQRGEVDYTQTPPEGNKVTSAPPEAPRAPVAPATVDYTQLPPQGNQLTTAIGRAVEPPVVAAPEVAPPAAVVRTPAAPAAAAPATVVETPPVAAAPPAGEVPPVEAPTKFKATGPATRMIDPEAKGIAKTILREMSGGGKTKGKIKVPK